jgi:hypothetical protein
LSGARNLFRVSEKTTKRTTVNTKTIFSWFKLRRRLRAVKINSLRRHESRVVAECSLRGVLIRREVAVLEVSHIQPLRPLLPSGTGVWTACSFRSGVERYRSFGHCQLLSWSYPSDVGRGRAHPCLACSRSSVDGPRDASATPDAATSGNLVSRAWSHWPVRLKPLFSPQRRDRSYRWATATRTQPPR